MTARLVVVAQPILTRDDVVALTAVKFWRVVEPVTKRSPEELMVVVPFTPEPK